MTTHNQAWRFGWHFQVLCFSSRLSKIDSLWIKMFRSFSGGVYPCCEYLLSDKHENPPWKDHILSKSTGLLFEKTEFFVSSNSILANYLIKKPKVWVTKLCLWNKGAMEAGDIGKASSLASKDVVLRNSRPHCSDTAQRRKGNGTCSSQWSTTVSLTFRSVSLRNKCQPFPFLFVVNILKVKLKSLFFRVGF